MARMKIFIVFKERKAYLSLPNSFVLQSYVYFVLLYCIPIPA